MNNLTSFDSCQILKRKKTKILRGHIKNRHKRQTYNQTTFIKADSLYPIVFFLNKTPIYAFPNNTLRTINLFLIRINNTFVVRSNDIIKGNDSIRYCYFRKHRNVISSCLQFLRFLSAVVVRVT